MSNNTQDDTVVVQVIDGAVGHPPTQAKIAGRQVADAAGRCPTCGATIRKPNRSERRAMTRRYGADLARLGAVMEHEAGCPVGDGQWNRSAS